MDNVWKETVNAIINYKQDEHIIVQFYQPGIDTRQSVVERISGLGHARLEEKKTTK